MIRQCFAGLVKSPVAPPRSESLLEPGRHGIYGIAVDTTGNGWYDLLMLTHLSFEGNAEKMADGVGCFQRGWSGRLRREAQMSLVCQLRTQKLDQKA